MAYFFVDGHAQIIPKDKTPITFQKVNLALDMIWEAHYDAVGIIPKASSSNTKPKSNVIVALNEMGFFSTLSNGAVIKFEKKTPELKHIVFWNKDESTLDYTQSKNSMVTVSWTENVGEGLAMLANIFTPKLSEEEFVVAKMEELGFKPVGGKPPTGAQSNTITF